ncbi:MAG: hypothetical protein EOO68_13165 [Moraxellaceae bacterium]|nr:MAG: hypothetical protein EOO68_13165 [Moraxellaceae bacterium]
MNMAATFGQAISEVDQLIIENVTGPIAPDGSFGIGLSPQNRNINLIVADGVVINTLDNPAIAGFFYVSTYRLYNCKSRKYTSLG